MFSPSEMERTSTLIIKIYETKHGKQPTRGLYIWFKVNFSLKTTTLHSGVVVQKNKFTIIKNGYKGMATFIYIHK